MSGCVATMLGKREFELIFLSALLKNLNVCRFTRSFFHRLY